MTYKCWYPIKPNQVIFDVYNISLDMSPGLTNKTTFRQNSTLFINIFSF